MRQQCPQCGSYELAKVGQNDKFLKWGGGGALVLFALGFVAPGFWIIIPLWMFGSLAVYMSHPLLECKECGRQWDPRKRPVETKS
ncbi:MAG: hypothetical protein H0Z39_07455 [Peptococcaceae bacterium]|nr:hypothetical protein [Peptococcaceae bacterium]